MERAVEVLKMGMRGIDIQVAIQRAAEAQKIQQGEISQARAGEAGSREAAEAERARRQEQPQKTERQDQVIIRSRKKRQTRDEQEEENQNEDETQIPDEENENIKETREQWQARMRKRGKLDIIA